MANWFDQRFRSLVETSVADAADIADWAEAQAKHEARTYLAGLKAGSKLSTKPLIVVMATDNALKTVRFLALADMKFFGALNAYARVEAVVDYGFVDLIHLVRSVPVALGDLRLTPSKPGATLLECALRFQKESDVISIGGGLTVRPLISLAAYGGLGEGKFIIDLDAKLPEGASIPLGPTGLGLRGIGGTFAHNFQPRLTDASDPEKVVTNPTATDYVRWARIPRSHVEEQWKPAPAGQSVRGFGLRTYLGTADGGFLFDTVAGFAYLDPGAIIIGGEGTILRQPEFKGTFYGVIDVPSGSLAMNMGATAKIKAPILGGITAVEGQGQVDLFFSFIDPTAWFVDFGRADTPHKVELLPDVGFLASFGLRKAEAYLRINHHRIAFGARLGIGGELKVWVIKIIARVDGAFAALMARDPLLVKAELQILGEVGIEVWDKFDFKLRADTRSTIYLPRPLQLTFNLDVELDLPWPVPDIKRSVTLGGSEIQQPSLAPPLIAGQWRFVGAPVWSTNKTTDDQVVPAGQDKRNEGHHLLSNQSFDLTEPVGRKAWPDIDIVVPFTERATDSTGTVLDVPVAGKAVAGYLIEHRINKIEIFDLVESKVVPDVHAVWTKHTAGTGNVPYPVLRVLGQDPFSWLTPHTSVATSISGTSAQVYMQNFGPGRSETLLVDRHFERLIVSPAGTASLTNHFSTVLKSRVLRAPGGKLRFLAEDATDLVVDSVELLVVVPATRFKIVGGGVPVGSLGGGLELATVTFNISPPSAHFDLPDPVPAVFAVRFRAATRKYTSTAKRTLLKPGRYRFTIDGVSSAKAAIGSPSVFLPAKEVEWRAQQTFETTYPETARPYIFYPTFGDARLFAKPQEPWSTAWANSRWNPTEYGIGFPAYRAYQPVIRFLVPYIGDIYPSLKTSMRWDDESRTSALALTSASDGASSLSQIAKAWIGAGGAVAAPDAEATLADALPAGKVVTFALEFEHPQQGLREIDTWAFRVSAFADFKEHLSWTGRCLTVHYDAAGRHVDPACRTIVTSGGSMKYWPKGVVEMSMMRPDLKNAARAAFNDVVDLLPRPVVPEPQYPTELTSAPTSWRLPPPLAALVGPIDESGVARFIAFARASGAWFGGTADPLEDLTLWPGETELASITDDMGRVRALWLRTPEPVDWRRVTFSLTIRHVLPDSGCPVSYAQRHPLVLDVFAIPSTDGASAFLVASFGGVPMVLPRGEFQLRLTFDPKAAGLPVLRPDASVGPEIVEYRFIQPLGATWPLPTATYPFRLEWVHLLLKHVDFDARIWEDGVALDLSAAEIEQRIRAARPGPSDGLKFLGGVSKDDESGDSE